MKIQLFDVDEFVKINNIEPITSPVLFQRGDVPHPSGLISNEIFGVTTKKRKRTYGYIDLHTYIFNPIIYKVLRRLYKNIDTIVSGEKKYIINSVGNLEHNDEHGETGIKFLYDNWDRIKWTDDSKDASRIRDSRIKLLTDSKKKEIFISKMIVLPPFYRDIRTGTGGGGQTDEINNLYAKLIRYGDIIKNQEMFDFQFDTTIFDIQNTAVDIYNHFKQKLEKKNGLVRKYLMGKNVDYCTRTVITAPIFHANTSEDLYTDFEHTSIPLSQICSLCYPFIIKWVKDFIEREIFDNKQAKEIYDPVTGKVISVVAIDSPETLYTDTYIKKAIDSYIKNPESRFNKIEVPVTNSNKPRYLAFRGRLFNNTTNAENSQLVKRPMTWTDLLYMAANDVVKDKHVEITRYPVNDRFGIFFSKIRVATTQNTVPMIVNGVVHKWYPDIDLSIKTSDIPSKFIDSCRFSNAYLPGMGGDYDGDQTTVKILFTQEANEEIDKFINSKSFFINDSGKKIRTVSNECEQTFYVLTKDPFGRSRELNADEVKYFLSLKDSDFTFDAMLEWFSDTLDCIDEKTGKAVKKHSEFNVSDTFTLHKGDYPGVTSDIKTTLGRYIFNVVMIRSLGFSHFIPYRNDVFNAKVFGDFDSSIVDALRTDVITVRDIKKYIDRRDWFGLQLHAVITSSFTPGVIKVPEPVKELKDKLMKQHEKELNDGDVRVIEDIEKKLIDATIKELKDDIGLDLYVSGARGSIGNHLKNTMLTRGAVQNPNTKKYEIIQNSLMDGLAKKDIGTHSNVITSGAYPKSVGTQVSGYMAKQLLAGFQGEILAEKDSDCGSLRTLRIKITKNNANSYIYRYIVEKNKNVLLTEKNINNYIDKYVDMRSPMFCASYGKEKCLCNICAGDYYYILGNKNIGLITNKIGTGLVNLGMKKFHNNTVNTKQVDVDDMLL